MPTQKINPCLDSHQELSLMTEVTSFGDQLPVMHCNRCGTSLSFEDAVRNDERLKLGLKYARVPYVDLTEQELDAIQDWIALHDIDYHRVLIDGRIERDPATGDWLVEALDHAEQPSGTVTLRQPFKADLPWPARVLARRVLAYVVRDPDLGTETGYSPDAVRIVYEES